MQIDNIVHTLKRFLLKSVIVVLKPLPIKHNRWVFGAWQGQLYSDNSKFMFEYIKSNYPEIDAIWISKNKSVVKNNTHAKLKSYYTYSLMGIIYTATAEIAFETEGNWDISPLLNSKKTKVIQLWHGVAPKKANWKSFETSHWHDQYWMVSSEQNKKTMQQLIGMDNKHVFVTGYPRNDVFFLKRDKSDLIKRLDKQYPGCKKVIYMPTHRNFGSEGPKVGLSELEKADKFFRKNNIVFVFKPHFHETKYYMNAKVNFTNIILAKNNEMYSDVYSYIADFDLLISDYSSIIYDFTCSHKPIVLFPYDMEEFDKGDAGLFEYYKSIPAGPFCYDWDSVLNTTIELLKNDNWYEKREICRKTFHPFSDGNNRKRVYETVLKLLKTK